MIDKDIKYLCNCGNLPIDMLFFEINTSVVVVKYGFFQDDSFKPVGRYYKPISNW